MTHALTVVEGHGEPPPDRVLHVLVVTDDEPAVARLLGSVRVAVESTDDNRHDCIHAILEASDALSTGRAEIEEYDGPAPEPPEAGDG